MIQHKIGFYDLELPPKDPPEGKIEVEVFNNKCHKN